MRFRQCSAKRLMTKRNLLTEQKANNLDFFACARVISSMYPTSITDAR